MNNKVNSKFKQITSVAITKDSKYLFAYDTSIRVFSLETKEEELKFPFKNERLVNMCISNDNRVFFASTISGHVYSFFLQEDYQYKFISKLEKAVTSITVSNDKRYVAASFNDRNLQLFDRDNETSVIYTFDKTVNGTVFSDDSNILVSAIQDSTVSIKTLDGSRKDLTLSSHKDEIRSISSNGDLYITSSGDKSVKIWSAGNNCCLKTILICCEKIKDATISFDGESIIILADNSIQV